MAANYIADEHARRNRTTSERWEAMAPHRTRVTRLIRHARALSGSSLCILGAGNANDFDLRVMCGEFARIALTDLDAVALGRAVERLSPNEAKQIELHGRLDLTALLDTLASWLRSEGPSDEAVATAIVAAKTATPLNLVSFDVVASTCLLTQLIDSVCLALAANHPRRNELILAVRNRHLDLMVELLRPGGAGVLITDFVSTETAPELANIDESALPSAALQWVKQGNFFTGANPYAIRDYYLSSSRTAPPVTGLQIEKPWRWDIGAKQFAVSAITFRRME